MDAFFTKLPAFLLLISAIVVVHEAGHFLVAKLCGVQVLRFSLGFGPRLFSRIHGDTEYQVSLLPLGGYVKMLGDTPGAEVPPELQHRAFFNKPVGQRFAIVLAGPTANMLLAGAIYFCMAVGTQELPDTRLGLVSQSEPAYAAGLRPGDKIVAVQGRPTPQWQDLQEAIASRPDADLEVQFERPDDVLPQVRSLRLHTASHAEEDAFGEAQQRGKIGISFQYLRPVAAVVDSHSPAAQAGLRSGDRIVAVGGVATRAWHEVRAELAKVAPDSAVTLQVQRGATTTPPLTLHLQPRRKTPVQLDSSLFSAADAAWGYTGVVSQDTVVAQVEPHSPAAGIGVAVGDRLLQLEVRGEDGSVHSRPVGIWALDLATFGLDAKSNLMITLQRDDQVFARAFHLQERETTDSLHTAHKELVFGASNAPGLLDAYTVQRVVGPFEAVRLAGGRVVQDMGLIAKGLSRWVRNTLPAGSMGGPIMLFQIAGASAKLGALFYFHTMAAISVNIGMMNLLPIPVLDGGHLFFFLIEAISRRPPSVRVRTLANAVGLCLLMGLMLYTVGSDLRRFILQ